MGKLNEQQRNEIKQRYLSGTVSYAALAEEYGVSPNTIARIMNPSYYERERAKNRERIKSRRNQPHSTEKAYPPLICNREKDADIMEKLDSVRNRNGYIKGLIRKDISEEK